MTGNQPLRPQKLAGFRDFFAEDIQVREYVVNTFKQVFEKYGYEPLETPALEYANIFQKEAGEEAQKLFYQFKDQGGRDIMLKYEVMISMCRAVAENYNQITFPYKRYQIQPVWRAEKPQKGRYREFTQCDADTVGSSSIICDAEFIQMGIEVLQKLGFKEFTAQISNRKFLNGIIQASGASDQQFIPLCLSIDKLPKIGSEKVKKELTQKRNIPSQTADKILNIVTLKGNPETLMKEFRATLKDIPIGLEGLNELEQIFNYLKSANIPEQYYEFSPFIARGLAYYTGPIWEFEITEGNVGSVAGCGRYDKVIGNFTGKPTPATGGSFGIERIVEIIRNRQMINITSSPIQVLLTLMEPINLPPVLKIAQQLRSQNISTMLYPETAKMSKQLKYADKKGVPWVVILGPDEVKQNKVTLKNMQTGEQQQLTEDQLINKLKP